MDNQKNRIDNMEGTMENKTEMITGLTGLVVFTVLATVIIMSGGAIVAGIICASLAAYSGAVGVTCLLAYDPNQESAKNARI